MTRIARTERFFFMHLGTLLGVIVFFVVAGGADFTLDGVGNAIIVALVAHTAYMAVAWARGYVKQLDVGLLVTYGVGSVAAVAHYGPILELFRRYFGVLFWTSFAAAALIPLLLGRRPFTYFYASRQLPAWQQKLDVFHTLNRIMAVFWFAIFAVNAILCATGPENPLHTLVYPNLLVFLVGVPAPLWVAPLYVRLFSVGLPPTAEAMVMGMPFFFDRRAAAGALATIQFCVDGDAPGEYWVRIARGRCETFEGRAPAADLTIRTPGAVWVGVARGEIDGARALAEGRYRVEGDIGVLAQLPAWFPQPR